MPWSTPGTVAAGQVYTAARYNTDTVGNLLSLVEAGTALPTSPADQQSFYYIADATNGIVWHLRYRSASSSSYKWEYVGGPPLTAEITGEQTTTSTSYTDLATAGPSVTLPLGGDYIVTIAARMNNVTANQSAIMSYAIGASTALDADSITQLMNGSANGPLPYNFRERRKTGLSAVTLTMKYRSTTSTAGFQDRFIKALPIRVG